MHPLEKEILHILKHYRLILPGEMVLAAVSAGPDSMAMLHVLAALRTLLDFNLTVVYVNHGLRPTEAAGEEALVREQAEKLGLAWKIGVIDVGSIARTRKVSIEHAARLGRYGFLEEAAVDCEASKIAMGHTADDQGEELLLRLIRGTGRRGLSGMTMLRDGRFIRPLLKFPKSQLLTYLEDQHIPFAIDSSNHERQFLRNRVRLDLLPFLSKTFNPSIKQTLLQTADILREEEELLAESTTTVCRQVFIDSTAGTGDLQNTSPREDEPEPLSLDLEKLAAMHKAIQRRVLEAACLRMRHVPQYRQLEQILLLCTPASQGRSIHLGNGLRISRENKVLTLSHPAGITRQRGQLVDEKADDHFEMLIEGPGTYLLNHIGKAMELECVDTQSRAVDFEPDTQYLDLRQCPFPLTVRSPRPGDKFQPLGSPGRKKVGDFFTDRKIARKERHRSVVVLARGKVAALIGLAIDHHCRIKDNTSEVLKIRITDAREG